ncbi:MAG: phosphoribosylformylglycinamidine synthase subunit PurS [Planctomycetes bacterium]|nr:phosphoribosylformylglycinamidine synthase subunit PurS [Planctomycetota bacterium]
MTATTDAAAPVDARVHRIEVRLAPGEPDPFAGPVLNEARAALGAITGVESSRIYLVEAALDPAMLQRIADELVADAINQRPVPGASPAPADGASIEVHYQPGVMDPVAQSTREAIAEMFPGLALDRVEVRTGFRYDLHGCRADADALRKFAERSLANTVIQDIHLAPFLPECFQQGSAYTLRVGHVAIRDLDDAGLMKMSREAHLFLSLDEMRAVRDHYRAAGRDPADIEIETIAQTWSEHCVHKTLKSTIRYREANPSLDYASRPGHSVNADGSITIQNLLKSTVAAATNKLMQSEPHRSWCISVFKDNSGIVKFDETDAVCIKVETHNHPSAIEPYGGAATGIGGCIRDVMGTGMAARPIANTNVFCVAFPQTDGAALPKGVIPPRRVLQQVVSGVRDYGNRMGIPTVNGAVWFHPDYLANPLVFAGCIGLIPLDKCFGTVKPGDRIIALGGRTGRDGIHGATFSSAELTDTHADEFAHAVQIGNAITQKKTLDVILQARDAEDGPLFNGLTDCGAGGFSSAIGEMGKDVGARVTLDTAPLKYQGLSYTEIWISEAQERMTLAVPPDKVDRLRALCESENVEFCDLGEFGHRENGEPTLLLTYHGTEVGRLSMHFLHDGIPTPTREAEWGQEIVQSPESRVQSQYGKTPRSGSSSSTLDSGLRTLDSLLSSLLSHPNIASKHWIIRQYDHEVQGGAVIKPLVGRGQDGPSDASVLRPKLNSPRGIALGCGLQTGLGEKTPGGDSYWMTLAAIDEAVRNVVCAGASLDRIAILDNFCWPRCDDPKQLGSLVRAAEACYDGALAYRTPFVSGKDSLSNQFTTEDGRLITIPPTLLITALGIVPDVTRCRTMDAKSPGNSLLLLGATGTELGGSHYHSITGDDSRDRRIPHVHLSHGPRNAAAVAALLDRGLLRSAHDCSDGGMLAAAAEMAFAGRVGLDIELDGLPSERELDDITACFAETPSRYLVEVEPGKLDMVVNALRQAGVPHGQVGRFAGHQRLTVRCAKHGRLLDASLDELRDTWRKPLDW